MTTLYNGDDINILIRAIEELEKKGYIDCESWNGDKIHTNKHYCAAALSEGRKNWNAWLGIEDDNTMSLFCHGDDGGNIVELTPDNFDATIASFPNLKTV